MRAVVAAAKLYYEEMWVGGRYREPQGIQHVVCKGGRG
jgi:hypothetical protein